MNVKRGVAAWDFTSINQGAVPRQPLLAAALDAMCISEGAVRFHHLFSGNADQPFHRVYVLCEEAVEQSIFVQQPEKEVGWSGDELSRTIGLLT